MKHFKRNKKGDNITERLAIYNTDRAGCEIHGGVFDSKTGKCSERQLIDEDRPGEVLVKEFDEVKRASDIGGTQHIEDPE